VADLVVPLPRRVAGIVHQLGPRARQAAVDEAVAVLRGPTSSVPVKTGRLKRSFRRLGLGAAAMVYSPVPYASFHREKAVRTLNNHVQRIIRAARRGRGAQVSRTPTTEFVRRRAAREDVERLRAQLFRAQRNGQVRDRRLLSQTLRELERIDIEATG